MGVSIYGSEYGIGVSISSSTIFIIYKNQSQRQPCTLTKKARVWRTANLHGPASSVSTTVQ
jgi:hypothetical protein